MSSYRQPRRHARQARHAGMQPMMVINPGDPFPGLPIAVIARRARRYRSELAPPRRATVDLRGWRARPRLARGQTTTGVTAKIPALESGLGTHRGAIRIYPAPDDLANRREPRVPDRDPHADAIPWPGPAVTSITQPACSQAQCPRKVPRLIP